MKTPRTILALTLLLALSAAACTSPTPTPGPPPAGNLPSINLPPPPPPLQVTAAQRLSAIEDNRFPPADFGKSIALGEGVLAVGSPSVTGGPEFSSPGSVYVYRKQPDGWALEARLSASDQEDGFQYAQAFGSDLAIEGNLLFVGAPKADDPQAGDNAGAVYRFQHMGDTWEETGILNSPQPAAEAQFGTGVALNGDHLAVLEGHPYNGSRLHLFHSQEGDGEWRPVAVVEAPQADPAGRSGVADFAIFANHMAVSFVSFQGEAEETRISGSTRLYQFNGESWVDQGSPFEGQAGAVALNVSEDAAIRLVLTTQSTQGAIQPGAVLIFKQTGEDWILEESLVSTEPNPLTGWGSGFGGDVALQGNLLLVGGPGASEDAFWDGVAYLYQLHEGYWFDQLRLIPPEDGSLGDFFGSRVAVFQDTLLVSAPNEFGNAVYVYEVGARDENGP